MQDSKCTAQIDDLCYGKVLVEGIYCDDKGTEDEIFAEVLENLQEYIYNKDVISEAPWIHFIDFKSTLIFSSISIK